MFLGLFLCLPFGLFVLGLVRRLEFFAGLDLLLLFGRLLVLAPSPVPASSELAMIRSDTSFDLNGECLGAGVSVQLAICRPDQPRWTEAARQAGFETSPVVHGPPVNRPVRIAARLSTSDEAEVRGRHRISGAAQVHGRTRADPKESAIEGRGRAVAGRSQIDIVSREALCAARAAAT